MSKRQTVTGFASARRVLPLVGGLVLLAGLVMARRKSRVRSSFKYHPRYEEFPRLRNGMRVFIRPLLPRDGFRMVQEMGRLSKQSRYLRFHRPKEMLTDEELRYLTRMDGIHHFALVAMDLRGNGLGVGRFIRYAQTPEVADVAITVADRVQAQGLGRLLLERLIEAAREREIQTLRCEVLSGNRAALHLFKNCVPGVRLTWEAGVATLEIPTGATIS